MSRTNRNRRKKRNRAWARVMRRFGPSPFRHQMVWWSHVIVPLSPLRLGFSPQNPSLTPVVDPATRTVKLCPTWVFDELEAP